MRVTWNRNEYLVLFTGAHYYYQLNWNQFLVHIPLPKVRLSKACFNVNTIIPPSSKWLVKNYLGCSRQNLEHYFYHLLYLYKIHHMFHSWHTKITPKKIIYTRPNTWNTQEIFSENKWNTYTQQQKFSPHTWCQDLLSLFAFLQMVFFHFLTCFTLCFYFLCAHEHMFYYGMRCTKCTKKIIIIIIIIKLYSILIPVHKLSDKTDHYNYQKF